MTTNLERVNEAVQIARRGDYLNALNVFLEVYGTDDMPPLNTAKAASGLSYFGLCLALVQRKYKTAVELCRRALDLEFYNGDHYANLTRVYSAAGNRKKAIETANAGLKLLPEHKELQRARGELGVRSRPTVPFLDRTHPINVSLGHARHAKRVSETQKKKK
jgi:tetratricopeptide (TPR) repeat protein